MDHHDWSQWPEDQPHLDDADTADLQHPGDGIVGGLDDQPLGHDVAGDDLLGHDTLDGYADGEPGGEAAHHFGAFDAAPDLAGETGHDGFGLAPPGDHTPDAGHTYPDDDPFAGHDGDGADADHPDADHPDAAVVGDAGADHDPGGHDPGGHDPGGHDPGGHDPGQPGHDPVLDHDGGPEPAGEHLVGSDPDVDPHADGWHDPEFPPPLELPDAPQPVDGYPWSDASVLGTGAVDHTSTDHTGGWGSPDPGDLYDYAGLDAPAGETGWAALLGGDDPAAAALARWWAPSG
jgi:hypothetical protein